MHTPQHRGGVSVSGQCGQASSRRGMLAVSNRYGMPTVCHPVGSRAVPAGSSWWQHGLSPGLHLLRGAHLSSEGHATKHCRTQPTQPYSPHPPASGSRGTPPRLVSPLGRSMQRDWGGWKLNLSGSAAHSAKWVTEAEAAAPGLSSISAAASPLASAADAFSNADACAAAAASATAAGSE